MTNKKSRSIVAELRLAIWGGLIACISIYFLGIVVANTSKVVWIKPICSALAMISGISVLRLQRIIKVDEYIRQAERDILLQTRADALYQQSNLSISELKGRQIYQDW